MGSIYDLTNDSTLGTIKAWCEDGAISSELGLALIAEIEKLQAELLERDAIWLPDRDAEIERLKAIVERYTMLLARARVFIATPEVWRIKGAGQVGGDIGAALEDNLGIGIDDMEKMTQEAKHDQF